MMTLEEAIKHCKDVALSCTNKECALEHFQLLKWLQEYSNMLEKQCEQKPTDKVEPKFHEGEWIVDKLGNTLYVKEVYDSFSNVIDKQYRTYNYDNQSMNENCHLWTIQNAKEGDVLVNQNGEMPFIFKECKDNHIYCYCGYTNRKDIFFDKFVNIEGEELYWLNLYHEQVYPATKEQRDLLFSKMKEAGYTFDFKKKELKKIEQKTTDKKGMNLVEEKMTPFQKKVFCIIDTAIEEEQGLKQVCDELLSLAYDEIMQKPAWSEEDEQYVKDTLALLAFGASIHTISQVQNWLKSLEDRVSSQPKQEWSEEDERIYQSIMDDTVQENQLNDKQIIWLRNVKYRYFPQPKQEWGE